jgi:predicted Zn-dependent peptidase
MRTDATSYGAGVRGRRAGRSAYGRPRRAATVAATILGLAAVIAPLPAQQREEPPVAGTPKNFRLPPARRFTLPNDIEVTMVPFGTVPKVSVRLALRAGNADEPANAVWLAGIVGDLMQEGTTSRTAEQIAREFATMGGALKVGVGLDRTDVSTDVLSERGPDAVRLIADVARNPRLPESDIARIKTNKLRQLAIQRSQPQPLAQEKFSAMLYGDHPYGRIFPTEEMLKGFTIEQVRAFHRDNFRAAGARLYVAGVFDAAATEAAIRQAFGDWERGRPPTQLPAPRSPDRRDGALIDRPDAPQSTIYLGLHVPGPSSSDWIPLQVTDYLLGGAFGSRVTTNIREQKGYTYAPYSFVQPYLKAAHWVQVADVTTTVTGPALREIFAEIDRLQKEPPPAAELRGIQNNLAGIFTLQNASRGGVIGELAFVDLHGLGQDYLTEYVGRMMAVSPTDVRRITSEYLRPERMTLVVVGDKKAVQEQLAPWMPATP